MKAALVKTRPSLDVVCFITALIGALMAGLTDFRNDEPQATVIVIAVFAGLLGFIRPRMAWRWALIVGLGVPIVYLLAIALGYQARSAPEPGWYASLIALIPAFVSAYGGVLLRKVIAAE